MAQGLGADAIVRRQLKSLLVALEQDLDADVLTYVGPIGANKVLSGHVREYHKLLLDYLGRISETSVVQTRDEFQPVPWRVT
jgi:hypothetical protein